MEYQLNITGSCVIKNNLVYRDENIIYKSNKNNLTEFLICFYKELNIIYPKFYKMDNLCKLGFLSSEIILKNIKLNDRYNPFETGVILSNAHSSFETDVKYYETVDSIASPSLFAYTLPNILIGEICIRNNIKGENTFFISPQFDIDMLVPYIKNLFMKDVFKACIFGWIECSEINYKAVLFLIEKDKSGEYPVFNEMNITKTYIL